MATDVRGAVLRRLATPHADRRFNEAYFTRPVATEVGCRPHQVLEALWGLVGEGLVADPRTIDEMQEALDEMRQQALVEDYESWSIPHRRFHRLATSGADVRLSRMLDQLSDHAERYRRLYTVQAPQAWATGLQQHGAILTRAFPATQTSLRRRLAATSLRPP